MFASDTDDKAGATRYAPRGGKTVKIPAGPTLIVIPLRGEPLQQARDWLPTDEPTPQLKKKAEELARRDASERAKRRKQL